MDRMKEGGVGEQGGVDRGVRGEGDGLLGKVREVTHDGNVRRVINRTPGKALIEVPLTVGTRCGR